MIQSGHHEDYIHATSLGGPRGPRGPLWDPWGPWGPPVHVSLLRFGARPYSSGAHRPCSARAITPRSEGRVVFDLKFLFKVLISHEFRK
jgi:hypothetical protein